MSERYLRNSTVLAKIETTPGTDAVPTGAANAILCGEPSHEVNYDNKERNVLASYFGAKAQLAGVKYAKLSYPVELAGSGAAGTPPAYGPLLRACGMDQNIEATPDRVEYLPVTTGQESASQYYFRDGARYKLLYSKGNVKLSALVGEIPSLSFEFVGVDGGPAAATPSGVDDSAFKVPFVLTDANCGQITLGCTYAAGALSGGTEYVSGGIELDLGQVVTHLALLGSESVSITDRASTATMQLNLTAAQEVTFAGHVEANTTMSLGLVIGTTTGNKALLYLPAVQLTSPKPTDKDGLLLMEYTLRVLPVSGNDEVRLVML